MAEKKYYWLKMTDQFFEDKAIKKLRKIAGGDTYTIIYLKMLLTAIKQGNKMYFEGIEDDFMEELALELDEDTDNVKVTVSYLKSKGLIEVLGADEILLTQCAEMVGSETDAARRKRLQRDRERNRAIGSDPVPALEEENGIESPYVIHPGDEIKISMDTLTAEVDGDAAQSAIDQAMSALTTEGAEFSVTAEGVQVDLSDVQVDSESAAAQIEAALGMESGTLAANGIEVQTGATVTVPSELVQVDASGLQGATQEAVNQTDTEPVEKDTSANVNVTDTTTNAEDVQGKVEEDLQGAVGDASVEGSANVTFSDVTADTSGVLEQVTAELENAVSNVPANGHAEITLDQTNNSSEIYSLATGDVESAFSQDYTGGLVMGADAGDKYVAQIIIPAREYTEVEKENPNYDPENEEGTEQPTIKELKPVPFSMDRCELRLWEREV